MENDRNHLAVLLINKGYKASSNLCAICLEQWCACHFQMVMNPEWHCTEKKHVTACKLLVFSSPYNSVMVVSFTVQNGLCACFPLKVSAKCVCLWAEYTECKALKEIRGLWAALGKEDHQSLENRKYWNKHWISIWKVSNGPSYACLTELLSAALKLLFS